MKRIRLVVSFLLVLLLSVMPISALGNMDYVLNSESKHVSIPQTNRVTSIICNLGPEGGKLSQPSDIFVDKNNYIYITDTGNNRIVKLDSNGNYICSFTCNNTLSSPGGIYISDNGDIYIADTINERIVHLSPEGEYIEKFIKPDSDLLNDSSTFQVNRIGITSQGYIYTIQGQYFMMIDANNEFKGYVGSNHLGFSLSRFFIRTFASKEQQKKLIKEAPTSYNSFDIGPNGLVYATTGEDSSINQIQEINVVGNNIFPQKAYGEKYFNKETNRFCNPRFVDICVDNSGIIYVAEAYSCNIYAYDQEGNMLAAFGGSGKVKGKFNQPIALDTMSNGDLLVLDKATGYIHHYSQTGFMTKIIQAVTYYNNGDYDKSEETWKQVLLIDANYPVANNGIGNALYKQGKTKEAMDYYKLSDSKSGYGTAFSVFQYDSFRAHFGLVVLIIVAVAVAVILAIIRTKKYADHLVNDYYSGGKKDE